MACVLLLCSSHYWAIHFVPINKPVLSVCQTAIQPVSQWTHATGTRVPGHHSHKKHMHLIVLLFRNKWNRIGIWGQTAYSTGIWFTRYTHSNSIRRIATVSHAAAQRQTGANKNRGLECVPPIFFFVIPFDTRRSSTWSIIFLLLQFINSPGALAHVMFCFVHFASSDGAIAHVIPWNMHGAGKCKCIIKSACNARKWNDRSKKWYIPSPGRCSL